MNVDEIIKTWEDQEKANREVLRRLDRPINIFRVLFLIMCTTFLFFDKLLGICTMLSFAHIEIHALIRTRINRKRKPSNEDHKLMESNTDAKNNTRGDTLKSAEKFIQDHENRFKAKKKQALIHNMLHFSALIFAGILLQFDAELAVWSILLFITCQLIYLVKCIYVDK